MYRLMKEEYDAALQAAYGLAEHETNGVLVNREGKERGIRGTELFSGNEERARKYASEELIEHWRVHGRLRLDRFEEQWAAGRVAWQE